MIPYGRQSIDEEDIAAVAEVMRGPFLTQGPHLVEFEEALASKVDARWCVAFTSATAALHAAVAVAEVGPGSTVATSPLSFVASANCAKYVGANVTFIDIDDTLNMDITRSLANVDALVAVHFAGLPMDLANLRNRPCVVIEDAAHALGASTPDGPVGNCVNSDMCVFSFHPVKSITTGEGGAVTTNDERLAQRLRRFRSHDIVRRPDIAGWYYEIETLGFNFRMTDMQAALGTSQLRKLDSFVQRRRQIADRYVDELADLPIELPPTASPPWGHAYHLFPVRVPCRSDIYSDLLAAGIATQVHYIPITQLPLYAADHARTDVTNAQTAYERLLSLPMFPALTDDEQTTVIQEFRRAVAAATHRHGVAS